MAANDRLIPPEKLEEIRRELEMFADPDSEVLIDADSGGTVARWESYGRRRSARLLFQRQQVFVQTPQTQRTLTYPQFLSGPDMADVPLLARMIIRTHGSSSGSYVEPKARLANDRTHSPERALGLLQRLADTTAADRTRVVFVTADAGVGKTSTLKQLVRHRARDYDRRPTGPLYLYVDAQGRALARFSEALATELDDLRSRVSYHTIATLVRHHLIVPIIDGFDELIGTRGTYDDAFASLSAFLEELNGSGVLVASARSVYYEQEFAERANSRSALGAQVWQQDNVEVLEWTADEAAVYIKEQHPKMVEAAADGVEGVAARLAGIFEQSGASGLRGKPFFVTHTLAMLEEAEDLPSSGTLLEQLVDAYLAREVSAKLLSRAEQPLLTSAQLHSYFVELAREMWRQEVRELDKISIREVTDLFMQVEGLSAEAHAVVVERAPVLALMARGSRVGAVAFEHEIFFAYFLAPPVAAAIAGEARNVAGLLSKARLPVYCGRYISRLLVSRGEPRESAIATLGEAARCEHPAQSLIAENAGSVCAELLRDGALRGLALASLVFTDVDLHGVTFEEVTFDGVAFRRTDLSRTRFLGCIGAGITFSDVVVLPGSTVLDIDRISVLATFHGLRTIQDEGIRAVYEPADMFAVLRQCGLDVPTEDSQSLRQVDAQVVRLVERLSDAYSRANPVYEGDESLRDIWTDDRWRSLKRMLIAHGLIEVEYRPASGPRGDFLRRRFLPAELLAGTACEADVKAPVIGFWDEVQEKFPAASEG